MDWSYERWGRVVSTKDSGLDANDFPKKWAAMCAYASGQAKELVLKAFWPEITEGAAGALRGSLTKRWLKPSNTSIGGAHLKKWFDAGFKPTIDFQGDYKEFLSLLYEDWIVRCSEDFQRKAKSASPIKGGSTSGAVFEHEDCIRFDLGSVVASNDVWDNEGVIDQRFMYADQRAVSQWENVRKYGDYELYELCLSISEKITPKKIREVERVSNNSFSRIVLFGAGSPDKDWAIIRGLLLGNKRSLRVDICDASFYMLAQTKSEIIKFTDQPAAGDIGGRIDIVLHCIDFTEWSSVQRFIFNDNGPTIFAILGGTIGNIDEEHFFDILSRIIHKDDLLVIAGSFYKDSLDITNNGQRDSESQYALDAKRITINTVSNLLEKVCEKKEQDLSRIGMAKLVSVPFVDATKLPRKMRSSIPGTMASVFELPSEWVQVGKSKLPFETVRLFTSRRYIASELKKYLEQNYHFSCVDEAISVGGAYPFAHLFFRKSLDVSPPRKVIEQESSADSDGGFVEPSRETSPVPNQRGAKSADNREE